VAAEAATPASQTRFNNPEISKWAGRQMMVIDGLKVAVESARDRADACASVRGIYGRLQVEIDRRKPVCVASGKCCHFEAYGHRLYVTTLELATFALDRMAPSPGTPGEDWGEGDFERKAILDIPNHPHPGPLPVYRERELDGCPLQIGKLCGVHAIRPFGCRIFFCDSTATQWQQEQYELFHQELKQLHQRFDVPYFYVEWRTALAACF
jgi:Fe-S-cluster containining protein